MFFKVFFCAVKFFSYPACMVPQQRYCSMNQPGFPVGPYIIHHKFHGSKTLLKITSIYTHSFYTGKPGNKLKGSIGSCFFFTHTDTPIIILHQINNWQLMQCCKLKCLAHLSFCYWGIAKWTNNNRQLSIWPFFDKKCRLFPVSNALCNTSCRNRLHSSSTTLMYDGWFILSPVIWVIVIFSSAGKNIISFCQQLKHQRVWLKTKTQHNTFIPVIWTYIIAG